MSSWVQNRKVSRVKSQLTVPNYASHAWQMNRYASSRQLLCLSTQCSFFSLVQAVLLTESDRQLFLIIRKSWILLELKAFKVLPSLTHFEVHNAKLLSSSVHLDHLLQEWLNWEVVLTFRRFVRNKEMTFTQIFNDLETHQFLFPEFRKQNIKWHFILTYMQFCTCKFIYFGSTLV